MRIGQVIFAIDEANRRCTSHWPDGIELVAAPVYDSECEARAIALGYEGDDPVWQMTRDHDRLHHVLAVAQGHPWSRHLRSIAVGEPCDPHLGDQEERVVFLLTRAINRCAL